jgi:hypothetical protein
MVPGGPDNLAPLLGNSHGVILEKQHHVGGYAIPTSDQINYLKSIAATTPRYLFMATSTSGQNRSSWSMARDEANPSGDPFDPDHDNWPSIRSDERLAQVPGYCSLVVIEARKATKST